MGILVLLIGLASFVCFILVLIKQFQTAGVVHGIIGIITCQLWTLIWGWMNASKLGIRNLMLIWTALVILYWVLFFTVGGFMYSFGTSGSVTP